MRVAALDLGTNTFLCLIAEIEPGAKPRVLCDKTWLVRLGQDVHRTRRFHPEALGRARKALEEAARLIAQYQVERVRAVATSAARDVENSDELLAMCSQLSIPLEIISGANEAELTFRGACSDAQPGTAVIDVGGGSTELIVAGPQGLCFHSFDVGCVRLTELFFQRYPIARAELEKATAWIDQLFAPQFKTLFAPLTVNKAIAVAGTPTTLAALQLGIAFDAARIEGLTLTGDELDRWLEKLALLEPQEIHRQYQLELKRADVIVSGTLILRRAAHWLGVKSIQVSTKGVRFGVALRLAEEK